MRTASEYASLNENPQLDWTSSFEERRDYIQSIIDEAIAHGMTLSAKLVQSDGVGIDTVASPNGNYRAFKYRGNQVENILTARDNKVWRKE